MNIKNVASKSEELGQIFTSRRVARLMVSLSKAFLNKKSSCLDPCIGRNIFFEELEGYKYGHLTGMEIDDSLIDEIIRNFYKKPNRKLIIGDFFNLDLQNKFDIIIMNPPYVRQELLNSHLNSKQNITKFVEQEELKIPKKSNLYIYFLIKCLKHLTKNGILVAIVYDSWLFADYGRILKNVILNNYSLDKVIHFRYDAFEKVDVGATVLLISNTKSKGYTEYYSLNSSNELSEDGQLIGVKSIKVRIEDLFNYHRLHSNAVDFNLKVFIPISSISSRPIIRGISAIVNGYFIFKENRFPPYTTPLIKDVSKIKKFKVEDDFDYLLQIRSKPDYVQLLNYLKSVEIDVLNNPTKHKSLLDRIKKDPEWYVIKDKRSGNIIFNYYFRDNTHFIYNSSGCFVSDNFYNLDIKDNFYQNMCLLNSTLTKYTLFKFGRSQGRGLFKIQLSQFNSIPILNIKFMGKAIRAKLEKLGKLLIKSDRKNSSQLIAQIDNIILDFLNSHSRKPVTVSQLSEEMNRLRENRHG